MTRHCAVPPEAERETPSPDDAPPQGGAPATDAITYRPIGVVRTPWTSREAMPIQPSRSRAAGTVELRPEYAEGLRDLDGFSHVVLVYHLHLSRGYALRVTPYLDDRRRGLFATRSPRRPNPIGLSVVRLERVVGAMLHVRGVDMVDGTPLLDLKPHIPGFTEPEGEVRLGWLAGRRERAATAEADGEGK